MQTFLPYESFKASAECLDTQRLGKQRVEVYQLLRTMSGLSTGWSNHPCYKMWYGYSNALAIYGQACINEWVARGYKNTIDLRPWLFPYLDEYPPWLTDMRVHDSHKSNLLRKFPEYYSRYGWNVEDNLPYVWPSV